MRYSGGMATYTWPLRHQRPEVPQEQRAQQRRDVLPVGVRVREDADLVIAQLRSESAEPGSTPSATLMLCTSSRCRRSAPGSSSQVFRILPRSGMIAWKSLSRACLAEPPAESPSTRNSSRALGLLARAVGELARQRGPAGDALAHHLLRGLASAPAHSRSRTARSARRHPDGGCSHSASESRAKLSTSGAASREPRRSFICPANCGSWILIDSTKHALSQTSSGVSLMPRGTRLRNSQNSRTACATPARRPLTCVPPSMVGIRLT